MGKKQVEDAVINVVINGEKAISSFRELNQLRREQARLVETLNRNSPEYAQQQRRLEDLNAAHRVWRAEINNNTAAIDRMNKEMDETGKNSFFDKMKSMFSKDSLMVAGGNLIADGFQAGLSAINSFINGSEAAYVEAVKGQAQMDAALKSTQGVAGMTKDALNDMSTALMNQTGIDDDVISKSETMLLTFTNIRGKIYEQALPAIVDMTAAMNQGEVSMEGIQTTSIQVGKALNDPIKGVTALAKVGVTFNEQQKEQIKTLVESNHMMDAQAMILNELRKEFGGVAKSIADTDAGAMQKFETRLGNIQENIGGWITKGKSLFVDFLNPFVGWLEKVTSTKLSDTLREDQVALTGLQIELDSNNTSAERRKEIINQLKEQYPGYLSQIDTDRVKNSELLTILDRINESYVIRIAYQKRAEKLDDAAKKEADAMNDAFDQRLKLRGQLADLQQNLAEDGIKFTIKGRNENEKALYVYNNLLKSIKVQAQEHRELNDVLGSNKYDYLVAGLNVYGNAIVSSDEKLKAAKKTRKEIENDLQDFKASSGYNDKIPGADLLDQLAKRVNVLKSAIDNAKKGTAEYKAMMNELNTSNNILKEGANKPALIKQIPGEIDKINALLAPKSGELSQADKDSAAKKAKAALDKYNQALQGVRTEYLSLAEAAKKGTVDDLDAQLKVIDDKFNGIVKKLQNLVGNKLIDAKTRKELLGDINNINGKGGLRDQQKKGTSDVFKQKQQADADKENDEQYKNGSQRLDNVFSNTQTDLNKQEEGALSKVTGSPEEIEAQRFAIKEMYAQKTFELEQAHLQAMLELAKNYGKDTTAIESQIGANTVKENERTNQKKLADAQRYKDAKQKLQDLELDTIEQGALLLESVLNKNTIAYKAAFLVEKAISAARVVLNTEAAIATYAVAVAPLGPVGIPLLAAYTTMAHISEAISLAAIAKQTIDGVSGKGKYKNGGMLPDGPSHENGGLKLVDPYGMVYGEVEGGEPILSKSTYANNRSLVDALLNSNGKQLNIDRIQEATTSRERRISNLPVVAPAGTSTGNDKTGAALATEMNATFNALLAKMDTMATAFRDQKVILSQRVQADENAKMVQLMEMVNS